MTMLTITYANGTYTYNEFGTGGHAPHDCESSVVNSHNDTDHSDTTTVINEDCSMIVTTMFINGSTIINQTSSNGTSEVTYLGQGSGTLSI